MSPHFYQLLQLPSKKAPHAKSQSIRTGASPRVFTRGNALLQQKLLCLVQYFHSKNNRRVTVPQLLCNNPSFTGPVAHTLTIEAILLQVLLELVGTETSVFIHPEVSQAFCRRLGVWVLHPLWIDNGSAYPRSFTSLLFSAVFTLGPPPSTKSVAPSNSGVLDWQKERIGAYMLRVLYQQRAQDWWTPRWHTPPNSTMGGHGEGVRVGFEVEPRRGETVGLDRNRGQGLDLERR